MSFIAPNETNVFRIVQSIRALWLGRSNAVGDFTLRANETTTTVVAPNCGTGSRISITPRTPNAADALATTYIPAANVTQGQFIVEHASSADTDLDYSYAIQG